MSYKLEEIISPLYFGLMFGGLVLVLSTCVGLVILTAVRMLAKMHIKESKKIVMDQSQLMLWQMK